MRSYQYMDYIKELLKKEGLPEEIRFLPHVESSFNPHAYSKVGAAGMWQFMRMTARLYKLKIGYTIDERRDPYKATIGALRLLKDNYRLLKSWPLALTAYNHGARSMQRAIRKLGTRDIHTIIDQYRNRRFGFASKNFYATFMATVKISQYPQVYFPHFQKPKAIAVSALALPGPLTTQQVIKTLNVNTNTFKELNPSIRRSAYKMGLPLPKGHKVYIPKLNDESLSQALASLEKQKDLTPSLDGERLHIVSRGETLIQISQAYKAKMRDVIVYNQLSDPSRIYAGMRLKIPGKDTDINKIEEKQKVADVIKVKEPVKTEKTLTAQAPSVPPKKIPVKPVYGPLPPLSSSGLEGYNLSVTKIKGSRYRIEVETDETLGHFADWLKIPTQKIRQWNGLAFGRVIYIGQKLNLYLSKEQVLQFEQERNAYHLSIQEDFFENYRVVDTKKYIVEKGDTLDEILKKFEYPFWLVRRQQEENKLSDKLTIGQVIKLPVLEALNQGDNETPISLQEESNL